MTSILEYVKSILGLVISLSTVLGIFTGIVNKIFNNKLKPIEDRLDDEVDKSLERSLLMWRFEIVTFASELHKGIQKSSYEFDIIFAFIDRYNDAVKKLGIKNSLFEAEETFIKNTYQNSVVK